MRPHKNFDGELETTFESKAIHRRHGRSHSRLLLRASRSVSTICGSVKQLPLPRLVMDGASTHDNAGGSETPRSNHRLSVF
jgi:hypothetical protein